MEIFDFIRSFSIKNRTEDHVENENEINNDRKNRYRSTKLHELNNKKKIFQSNNLENSSNESFPSLSVSNDLIIASICCRLKCLLIRNNIS